MNELVSLFELKQEFIPANDFDVKVRNRKKQLKAYPRIKAYLENIVPE
jgi:hypothetical protein